MTTLLAESTEDFAQRLLATEDQRECRRLLAAAPFDRDEMRAVVLQLDEEAVRVAAADVRRMTAICDLMFAVAEQTSDEVTRAWACFRSGEALDRQSRDAEAVARLDEAKRLFEAHGMPVEAARTRINWAVATANLGNLRAAVQGAKVARAVLLAHGETLRVASLGQALGYVNAEHGRYRDALRFFTDALAALESLGPAEAFRAAQCHANRGLTLSRLGRYREALEELVAARDLARGLGQLAEAARIVRSIGETQMLLGNYAAALKTFDEAREGFLNLGLAERAAATARDFADCYLSMNRPDQALAVLDEERAQPAAALPVTGVGLLARRVVALRRLGRTADALAALQESRVALSEAPIAYRVWLALQNAELLGGEGAIDEARAAAREAARLALAAGTRAMLLDATVIEGRLALDSNDLSRARGLSARVLRQARLVRAAPNLVRAHELLGRIAETERNLALAARRYRTAVRQMEREQRGVIFEFRDSFAASRGSPFERLAALELVRGRVRAAFSVVEQAKSRALLDAISGTVQLRPPRHAAAPARRLWRRLTAARKEYAATGRVAEDPEQPPVLRAEAAARLGPLEERIAELIHRLQIDQSTVELADLYGDAPPRLPALAPATGLVEFYFSGDDVLRFVAGRSGLRGDVLHGIRPELERLLRVFRLHMSAAERWQESQSRDPAATQVQPVLHKLYRLLLDGALDPAWQAMIVVPHGFLHYLPFHALHDGNGYLVERLAVSYAPSATLLGICRTRGARAARTALVLGHSAGGMLPQTLPEAAAVARVLGAPLLLEGQASRRRLERRGRHAGIIHLAAHGRFRADAPLFSAIELADGPLTSADVFSLKLDARLVTLSGCETGRSIVGGGDELVGMTRAFLYAGAAALLVSQWRVEDRSTAELMRRFYTELEAGAGPAAALRRAQMGLIGGAVPQSDRSHPFFWAAFGLIGDGGA